MPYEIKRPTELADFFAYLSAYAPNFPAEDGFTNATAFNMAFKALELFIQNCRTEEGKECVRECERNLHVAYECYEKGDDFTGDKMVQETAEMFRRCRKYINISDA
jgi:hypothetical protein